MIAWASWSRLGKQPSQPTTDAARAERSTLARAWARTGPRLGRRSHAALGLCDGLLGQRHVVPAVVGDLDVDPGALQYPGRLRLEPGQDQVDASALEPVMDGSQSRDARGVEHRYPTQSQHHHLDPLVDLDQLIDEPFGCTEEDRPLDAEHDDVAAHQRQLG